MKNREDEESSKQEAEKERPVFVRSGTDPERVPPPSRKPREPKWMPGVVEVEFSDIELARKMISGYLPPSAPVVAAPAWPESFKKIFEHFGLGSWSRTFPLSYAWSTGKEISAREKNIQANRDRLLTFLFNEEADVTAAAQALAEQPQISWATPVPRLAPPALISEPLLGTNDQVDENHWCVGNSCYQNQWYIFRSRVRDAWDLDPDKITGEGIVIADVDWGCNPGHDDLVVDLMFNSMTGFPTASSGTKKYHGTAVLGLAGARKNKKGMLGVAYEATLWAIQAGDEENKDPGHWVAGIEWVRNQPGTGRRKVLIVEAQTENFGNIEMIPQINTAIKDAISDDLVVCVPAGNGGNDAGIADDRITTIPATGSILIGATAFNVDPTINRREDSNFGERVVVYAPGDVRRDVTCLSRYNDGYTNAFGATSGAAAKVAGVVALMLQVNGKLTHQSVCRILKESGSLITDDDSKPKGTFLDAREAVCAAIKSKGGQC